MRLLFTFAGGRGHLAPLVPIARAAAAAGHTVAFTGAARMVGAVEAEGFDAFPTVPSEVVEPPRRLPLLAVDPDREDRDLRDRFVGRAASERADGILAVCASYHPDVIVRDEVDFGAAVASERLGLPHTSVLVIAAGSFVRPAVVAEPLDALRAAHGLAPDPHLAMLGRHLVLSPFPPSFRDPAFPLPATARNLRPLLPEPTTDRAPDWLGALDGATTVYVTLGTVFNLESGDLFPRVLAGLRDLPIQLVATVGHEIDPDEFGPQPDNVHIERYVPQSFVLPRCDAVVCHAGSGTVMGALAHGLPLVLVPIGADQPLNAARCTALGLGRQLDAVHATPADVRAAVTAVLQEQAFRRAAERMRREITALPGPEHAVELLEHLAASAPV